MSTGVREVQEGRAAASSSSNDGDNVIQYHHVDRPAEAASGSDPSALEAQKETTLQVDTEQAHSAFTQNEKRFIILMISMASFFSPLSGQIYFPVMPTLVKNYHLTTALINLTITTYMILQGLAPSFMGTFADSGGRRPAYILAFAIYTAANIGLALQNSYVALMILRCVQSAGSSGTVAFGYGVVSDIATAAERGSYIGPMAAGVMVAPAIGPVIGGILAKFLGWRSVFWFLVIISGGYLVVFTIAVPETARTIVGDGSVPPKESWRMSVVQYWSARRRLRKMSVEERRVHEEQRARLNQQHGKKKIAFPNPLEAFAILLEKDALIIISYVGLAMLSNTALLTSIPNLFGKLYGFNDLQIGLCFLPLGVSSCIAAVLNGKLLDFNYRRTARKLGLSVDKKKGDDLRGFPIEQTRLQTFFPIMAVGVAAFIPYGWVLQQRTPLVAPLILQFIIGFSFIASLNTLNTLMVDLFPDRAATASAASNLVRCWLGAVGAAVVDHMLSAMGWGWCFAFWGLLMLAGFALLLLEYRHGMKWRLARLTKLDQIKAAKQAEKEAQQAADETNEDKKDAYGPNSGPNDGSAK
ncbi:putative MFS transporter [Aspergillus clavatus NRRL 1]|uniref:MFS transporter, putative n=1 Tax=Aspergillus clavatus (strain ATCC 1007 / CBS 513.65 / DSM 816 / NCTC 3887 / NRRL 1 / QM 1276 / 107) TaxID=344612 RepID=A1CI39_ASPCL|nr:MFS transporter, putative [Aspergillus clavatus NRRL 1]EAW10544.1 MFS transporter, putative [Aspergillus clavatus NRRL 1]